MQSQEQIISQGLARKSWFSFPEKTSEWTLWFLAVSVLLGMIVVAVSVIDPEPIRRFGAQPPDVLTSLIRAMNIVAVEVMIAAASTVFGVLVGFIFGIPRTIVTLRRSSESKSDASEQSGLGPGVVANTNLEEISDWLTKILVGVGLTQFPKITGYVGIIAVEVSKGFEHCSAPLPMGYAVLVYFPIVGFLLGWLATRLYLVSAMDTADRESNRARDEKIKKLSENQDQLMLNQKGIVDNQRAISLLMTWLAPDKDGEVDEGKMKPEVEEALRQASLTTREWCFTVARDARRKAFRNQTKDSKEIVRRTITVFRTLLDSEQAPPNHRIRAQLAYALMDQSTPEWAEALTLLNSAIMIRDTSSTDKGRWPLYEFNRAWCQINLTSIPPSEDTLNSIRRDLMIAAKDKKLIETLTKEKDRYPSWLKLDDKFPWEKS